MSKTESIGKFGEAQVGKYLEKMGYKVISYNYHSKYGEIDIISQDDKYTVFVEVKTRKSFSFSRGTMAVDRSKRLKIIKTALVYLGENQNSDFRQPRFDVAEVLVGKNSEFKIFYYENAFDVEECDAFF